MNIIKILGIGGLLATLVALTACKPAPLSSEEAFKQIREKGGFPKLVSNNFGTVMADSPLGSELKRLIKEGYMEEGVYCNGGGCVIAEKGKKIIELCGTNFSGDRFNVTMLYTHVVDVDTEADKRISVQGDSATVQFALKGGLSEYGQRIRKIDPSIVDSNSVATFHSYPDKHRIGGEAVAFFERWESGWRLVAFNSPQGNFSYRD
jgi:hypothetical protein